MSEVVAEGIIEARRLIEFAETFASRPSGMQSPLVTECIMHFNEDGIRVAVVDAANVAMINPGVLSKRAFESYDAPGAATIAINLERLIELVKPADGGSLVNIAVDMETRKLRLRYGSADLSMGLIDPESVRSGPSDNPDLDLPNTVTLTGAAFADALEVANLMSDHVRIACDPDEGTVAFTTRGDIDEGAVEYGANDLIDASITEESESLFSLDYLRCMAKPMPSDTEVTIEVGHEFPVVLRWAGIDGHFDVRQMVAPRIQSD